MATILLLKININEGRSTTNSQFQEVTYEPKSKLKLGYRKYIFLKGRSDKQ